MSKSKTCKECGKKKCDAKIGPYGKTKCGKEKQAHHIIPDYTMRKGKRPTNIAESDAGRINPDFPSLNNGASICLDGGAKEKGKEHFKAHKGDDKLAELAVSGKPPGTVSLGEAIEHSMNAVIAVKPECEKEIRRAVRKQFKGQDRKQRVRGVQDYRKLPDDAFDGGTPVPRTRT